MHNLRVRSTSSISRTNATRFLFATQCTRKGAGYAARLSTVHPLQAPNLNNSLLDESTDIRTHATSTPTIKSALKRLKKTEALFANPPSTSNSKTEFWRSVISSSREILNIDSETKLGAAQPTVVGLYSLILLTVYRAHRSSIDSLRTRRQCWRTRLSYLLIRRSLVQ